MIAALSPSGSMPNKVLLPLTLYENITTTMYQTIQGIDLSCHSVQIARSLAHVSECVSLADMIETNIYSDQNWHIQFLHCVVGLLVPIMETNQLARLRGASVVIPSNLGYSTELNRASLKNINRKNISNIDAQINCTLEDYTMMSYVCNQLSERDDGPCVANLFAPVCQSAKGDSALKLYDMLIKIDKTNHGRINTPISIRRVLQSSI